MLFTTLEYWLFFVIVFVLYHSLAHRAQNCMLLVASYLFYAAWDWRYAGLMVVSTAIAFVAGIVVDGRRSLGKKRATMMLAIAANLILLAVFKYFGFFEVVISDLFRIRPEFFDNIALNVLLPVGISFYVFQSISYVVDVYRGQIKAVRNPFDLALFVSFFPQLVAGPIERGKHFMPQVIAERVVDISNMRTALWLIAWGLYKKICIADTLAHPVNTVFATPDATGVEVYVAVVFFAFQIYCDFSGYTDIARGCARLLGFNLMLNFNLPYFARSPSDFWRRWHISLSTWLRDYLYISLGGSQRGEYRTLINLFLTMLIGGLWHGANYNFIVWGAYHGAILVVYRVFFPQIGNSKVAVVLSIVVMFQLTLFGWLLFRVDSMSQLGDMLTAIATNMSSAGVAVELVLYGLPLIVPLIAIEAWQAKSGRLDVVERTHWLLQTMFISLALFAAIFLDRSAANPFIYFQF